MCSDADIDERLEVLDKQLLDLQDNLEGIKQSPGSDRYMQTISHKTDSDFMDSVIERAEK